MIEPEEYNEYGEIKPKEIKTNRRLNSHQEHRIHETKDLFVSECYLCQKAIENHIKSFWSNDE